MIVRFLSTPSFSATINNKTECPYRYSIKTIQNCKDSCFLYSQLTTTPVNITISCHPSVVFPRFLSRLHHLNLPCIDNWKLSSLSAKSFSNYRCASPLIISRSKNRQLLDGRVIMCSWSETWQFRHWPLAINNLTLWSLPNVLPAVTHNQSFRAKKWLLFLPGK